MNLFLDRSRIADSERKKYEKAWNTEGYDEFSPGEYYTDLFGEISKCRPRGRLADLGCGSGRAAQVLKDKFDLSVDLYDITKEGLEVDLPFRTQILWKKLPKTYDYGFCCDVMEHIPMEYTMLTIQSMLSSCTEIFFSICLVPDSFGEKVGLPLHMTVMPYTWWRDRLSSFGELTESRDLLENGIYYLKRRKF